MHSAPIGDELVKTRRHLPHWQLGGSTYFVTFRSARGVLPEVARRPVIETVLFDHSRRYELFFGVVMPDHVHLLIRPLQKSNSSWHGLGEITKAVKGISARRINETLGTSGAVWQQESFDRIVRDEHEYREKLQYIWDNPLKWNLVPDGQEYPFYICPPER